MGKRKASAKPVVTQSSAASVMPKPTLVGVQDPAATQSKAAPPKPGPAPNKHEPTLLGLPKHLPTALPPLKATKSLPQGRESSLVGLSRQVVSSPRPQHKTGIRLKAPTPPPSAGTAHANKRHAAEPTDYNVEIIDAYAMPPLPARVSAASPPDDVSWDDDDVAVVRQGLRRNTLLIAAAVVILGAVAVAVWAFSGPSADEKTTALHAKQSASDVSAARIAVEAAPPVEAPPPVAMQVKSDAPPAAPSPPSGALSAAQIAGPSKATQRPALLAAKPAKLSAKARLRARAQARRARMAHRSAQR